jgi:hypothetical protein
MPGLIIVHVLWQMMFSPPIDGWSGIILGIEIGFAIISAILVGIALFVLRKRSLLWWHWIIISLLSVPAAVLILVLITKIEAWYGGVNPPAYEMPPSVKV